ncbi:hypothetical protein CRYUN_Cryun03dG0148500 [Craigia yunnanensis]
MNATTTHFRVGVLSLEEWEYLMHITARSVHSKRKIGMVVRKLLILGVLRLTYSMSVKNMVLRKDDCWIILSVVTRFCCCLCSWE